ncbi:methylthioribulose 1-phosphate dehydratase [Alicyclobacillus cycloheptanicus]|uniref:Methylthioribulose-1-phosphate dehydratase n=1 Tax=Alicyclobacillus cycloheptanicus TaxID=1457 RepID=A0ABT9XHX6_9BACL|nr:methylthioribulose 1-phosphate dehydratase [Alicyclobacillus cycloheptanicus]MDQ0189797.1 methylthioribulose-1-phosphate dehydratase [Alicyclobacillus cycloheptanicus]WDM02511.1 methylthioribulose 1-phosphate dehydratase [Alicyclobacillus cycloheptanicus]
MNPLPSLQEATAALRALGDDLGRRGWLPATSGNLSVRLADEPLCFAITRSGADKQNLADADVLQVDASGRVLTETAYRPSAETIVHIHLYETFGAATCGCILHVHTVFNNLASQLHFGAGHVLLADHELLKALGHWNEGARIAVPIVENFADLAHLGEAVRAAARPECPGVLVRNHGIYAWGADAFAAKRHLEAFEFLFEYDIRFRQAQAAFGPDAMR